MKIAVLHLPRRVKTTSQETLRDMRVIFHVYGSKIDSDVCSFLFLTCYVTGCEEKQSVFQE